MPNSRWVAPARRNEFLCLLTDCSVLTRAMHALLNLAHRVLHSAVLLVLKDRPRLLRRYLCRGRRPLRALHLLDAALDGFGLLLQVLNALLRRIDLLQLLQALLLRGGGLLEQLHASLCGFRRILRLLLRPSGLLQLINALLRAAAVALARQHPEVRPSPACVCVRRRENQRARRRHVSGASRFARRVC
jgi:hypothetical protein